MPYPLVCKFLDKVEGFSLQSKLLAGLLVEKRPEERLWELVAVGSLDVALLGQPPVGVQIDDAAVIGMWLVWEDGDVVASDVEVEAVKPEVFTPKRGDDEDCRGISPGVD